MARASVIIIGALIIAGAGLASCGGGGGSSSPPPVNNPPPTPPPPPDLSPGGIWSGTQTSSSGNFDVLGLVTETGEFHFIQEDGVQYIGSLGVSGPNAEGTFEAALPQGTAFADGSTSGGGSLEFAISERSTLSGTFEFVTGRGTATEGAIALSYTGLYDRDSSLRQIAGSYTNATNPGSDALTIGNDGSLFYQDGSGTNCTANGQVSLIDTRFNAYRVAFQFSGCGGSFAPLNGAAFSGIGTLDNTGSIEGIVAGVTGVVQGVRWSLIYVYQRTL